MVGHILIWEKGVEMMLVECELSKPIARDYSAVLCQRSSEKGGSPPQLSQHAAQNGNNNDSLVRFVNKNPIHLRRQVRIEGKFVFDSLR